MSKKKIVPDCGNLSPLEPSRPMVLAVSICGAAPQAIVDKIMRGANPADLLVEAADEI